MAGNVVPVGPWTGGLNQLEDARLIGDDQLSVCQNFDIGRTGELIVRPALRTARTAAGNLRIVGTNLLSSNITRLFWRDEISQVITYADGTNIPTGGVVTNVTLTDAGRTRKVVQYNNIAWFIPRDLKPDNVTTAQGISVDNATGIATLQAAMPRGSGAVVFKDRLFIFGPVSDTGGASQRVYYSVATFTTTADPTHVSFPAANFIDINPGDGEGVTAMAVVADTLVIFKRHSTYALFFDTDPGLGTLRKVNAQIGCTGPDAVINYENALYILDERTVYRVQNLLFTDIGKNLNLKNVRTVTASPTNFDYVINMGARILFVVYTGKATNYSYYVFNTEVDAWSEYTFTDQPERFYRTVSTTSFEDFYASKTASPNIYAISPFSVAPANFTENAAPVAGLAITKDYVLDNSTLYKRLFWWGVESKADNTGAAANAGQVTLSANGIATSAAPLVTAGAANSESRFIKGFGRFKFRFVKFQINANGPNTIVSAEAMISSGKNQVGAQVTA